MLNKTATFFCLLTNFSDAQSEKRKIHKLEAISDHPHDAALPGSASSVGVGAGAGMVLPIVGKLVGHRDPKITARYAHIADDPAKRAADTISNTRAANLSGGGTDSGTVVPIKR